MRTEKVITLRKGEKIKRIVRRFGLTYFPRGIIAFVLIAVPFFFMFPLFQIDTYGPWVFGVLVVIGALYTLRLFTEWYWNVFIITNQRVVDVDQRGFFNRVVSEASLSKIEDVSFHMKGARGAIFKIGTVVIQTAGAQVNLEMPGVKNPQDVHHLISESMDIVDMQDGPANHTDRVDELLGVASELSSAEARAFVSALENAIEDAESDVKGRTEDMDEEIEDLMHGKDE